MSYYREIKKEDITINKSNIVFPLISITLSITTPLGPYLAKFWGFKKTCIYGSILMGCSFYLCSFMPNFRLFTLMFSIVFGGILGCLNMLTYYINCKNDPQNKGKITGKYTYYLYLFINDYYNLNI